MIKILLADKAFNTSPNAGDPNCLCSRCLEPIKEDEVPIRTVVEETNQEYRFCTACQKAAGIMIMDEQSQIDFYGEDPF